MLINTISLACLDTIAKILTHQMSPNLVVFLYKFSLLIITLPWILTKGITVLQTSCLKYHFLRSVLSVAAAICFFSGLKQVSMSDAAALENIQYLIVCVVGILFFNEKCTPAKIISIAIGMFGACLVANPDMLNFNEPMNFHKNINMGYIYIFLAMSFWALNTITVKHLGKSEGNRTQMFYLLLFASIASAFAALINWSPVSIYGYNMMLSPSFIDFSSIDISPQQIVLILLMALFYFIHGLAYFNALKAELTVVIPFRYSKLLFSSLLGYIFFGEVQEDSMVYIGYALIITAGLTLLKDEISRRKTAQLKKA